jgi:hypothetical protein
MTKTKKVTVVFVHIGDILPKHLRKNIEFFKSTFPTQAICVIVDSYKVCIELKRMDVEYFVFSDETRHKINEVASKLGHDLSFRAGFWLTTLGRFFGLLEYINRFPETSVLQIENDVICFPNFPFYQFSQIEREIASS